MLCCTDGFYSRWWEIIAGASERQLMTKDLVHCILIAGGDIRTYRELEGLLISPLTSIWMGPGAHVVCYPLKDSNTHYLFSFAMPL